MLLFCCHEPYGNHFPDSVHLTFVFSALKEGYCRARQRPLRRKPDDTILWPSQDSWVANDVFFA